MSASVSSPSRASGGRTQSPLSSWAQSHLPISPQASKVKTINGDCFETNIGGYLGELKRVQRDCDHAYETALAGVDARLPVAEALEQSHQSRMVLMEQRLDLFQHAVDERLQSQRRDFEQRLQSIHSSSTIAVSALESSLVQHAERICLLEGMLDDQIHRGKALTEGVMQMSSHLKKIDQNAGAQGRDMNVEIRAKLDDLSNRIESQELAHARLYANVVPEAESRAASGATSSTQHEAKMAHLETLVNKLAAEMIEVAADTKLGPQLMALMDSVRHVAPKLQEHELGLTEVRTWREEHLRDMKTIMAHTNAMEKQLNQTLSSTWVDTNTLVDEVFRLKSIVDEIHPRARQR